MSEESLKKQKYNGLKFSESILIKERERLEKLNKRNIDRINDDYTLTEAQFNDLLEKTDKNNLKIDQLTYGIRFLSGEIKMLCYQLRH